MRVHVDEARRERLPIARDRVKRLALGAVADQRDAPFGEGDIGRKRSAAAAIVDAGVPENCV
jgi:hypothetical protein